VTLLARFDIARGEELLIDYAMVESEADYVLDACRCDSDHCRVVITGQDWRQPTLQERYQYRFLPFINERIAQLGGHRSTTSLSHSIGGASLRASPPGLDPAVPPDARTGFGHIRRDAVLRPVTVEAMTTRTALTRIATIHRVQSTPRLPSPPNAV
jgi:hypothetical protein